MNTQTQENSKDRKINRTESAWVVDWLKTRGTGVQRGWMGVYLMTPAEIAKRFHVPLDEVIEAVAGRKR